MRIETTRVGGGRASRLKQIERPGQTTQARPVKANTEGASVVSLWSKSPQNHDTAVSKPTEHGIVESPEARERRLRARLVRREAALRRRVTEVEASGLTHWSVPRPAPSPTVYASATPTAVRWDAVRK